MPARIRNYRFWLVPLLLAGLVWTSWQHRFEKHPDGRELHFRQGMDLPMTSSGDAGITWDATTLRLTAQPGKPPPTATAILQPWPDDGLAHLHFSSRAENLTEGAEPWELGRVVVTWPRPDGTIQPGFHAVVGVRSNEVATVDTVLPMLHPGPPVLVIQHCGRAGSFSVTGLGVEVVRYRWWAHGVAAVLLAAVGGWIFAALKRFYPGCPRPRQAIAAAALLAMTWQLVFPGPWPAYFPLVSPLAIGPGIAPAHASAFDTTSSPTIIHSEPMVPGKLNSSPFWTSYAWVKSHVRWLMHLLVFAGLTILLALCLGTPHCWPPLVILAIASELFQWLFGFGADWNDLGDLTVNAGGIALGTLIARALIRRWHVISPRDQTIPPVSF